MSKKLSAVVAAVFAISFGLLGFIAGGPMPAVVFSIASGGGFILWLATTYKTPVDPLKIIVPYLLAVILFHIHVYEVYVTDFDRLIYIRRQRISCDGARLLNGLGLRRADSVAHRGYSAAQAHQRGLLQLSFFFVMMTIAALAHCVSPFIADGTFHYTSGMYTAALPLIPAGYGLYVVLTQIRKQKSSDASYG